MMDGSQRSASPDRDEEGEEVLDIVRASQTRRFSQQQDELLRRFSDPDLTDALDGLDYDDSGEETEEDSPLKDEGKEGGEHEGGEEEETTDHEKEETIEIEEEGRISMEIERKDGSVRKPARTPSTSEPEAAKMPSRTRDTSPTKAADEIPRASARSRLAMDSSGEGSIALPLFASEATSVGRYGEGPGAHSVCRGESSSRTFRLEDDGSHSGSARSGDIEEGPWTTEAATEDSGVHMVEAQLVDCSKEEDQNNMIVHANAVPESRWIWRCTLLGRDLSCHLLFLPIIAVLLIGLILALTMPISASRSSSPSSSAAPSTAPLNDWPTSSLGHTSSSSAPFSDVLGVNQTRLERVRSLLMTSGVTTEDALFEDDATPQYQALQWLVYQDPLQISLKQGSRLIQRYVLAVLYYSTGGEESWKDSMKFLSGDHECEWKYIDDNGEVKGVGDCSQDWGNGITTLDMWWHNLTGTLPNELGALTNLRRLNFVINELEGTIPSSLARLTNLEYLFINNNHFEGTVPSELGNLPYLSTITLYDNQDIEGDLSFFCQEGGQQKNWFVSDCGGGTSASVDCPCCSYCCDMEAGECCPQGRDGNSTGSENCWDPTPFDDNCVFGC